MEQKVCADLPFFVAGVKAGELPVEVIALIESVVHADRRRILQEHADEVGALNKAFSEYRIESERKIAEQQVEFESLEQEYETCARELKEQQVETMRVIEERNEARQNRDNAAAQLEEAHAEIHRLQDQVNEYQKAKVFGEREAQQIIDVTDNERDDIQAKLDAVRKLYTKSEDWGSVIKLEKPDGTFEVVKRDEMEADWAPITPPSLGGSDDTISFPVPDQAEPSEDTVLVAEISPFRETEVPPAYPISGLGGDTIDAAVEETFEQAVERRLAEHEARLAVLEERLAPITTEVA